MKYDGSKRKLDNTHEKETQVAHDNDGVSKIDMVEKSEHVLKVPHVINLIKKYNFTFGIVSEPFDKRITILAGGPNNVGSGGGGGIGG